MLCGVYSQTGKLDALAQAGSKLARCAVRGHAQQNKVVFSTEQLCLHEILHKSAASAKYLRIETAESVTFYLNVNGSQPLANASIEDYFKRFDWQSYPSLPGNWLAINWHKQTARLSVATDFIGSVWLYIAKTPDGFVFSQDYSSVSQYIQAGLAIDKENALLELVLGYVPDNSTLHKDIVIAPAAALIQFDHLGMSLIEQQVPRYGTQYVDTSQQEKYQLLDQQFDKIFTQQILPGIDSTCLSLSAGLDSRYILALLDSKGYSCDTFSYGLANSAEVAQAEKMAALINSQHTHFNFSKAHWQVWGDGIKRLGGTGKIGMSGWSDEWLCLLSSGHGHVLHGFLGDALSGKHLRSCQQNDWLDDWVNWSLSAWAYSDLLKGYSLDEIKYIVKKRLTKVTDNINFSQPHQMIMHLDIFSRQRRWVASQPNMMSDYLKVKTLFCDSELTNFWINLPFADLDNQKLYRDYAHSRFPKFFNPRSDSLHRRLQHKLWAKWQAWCKPRLLSYPLDRELIVQQNIEQIRRLSNSNHDTLSSMLDFAKLEQKLSAYQSSNKVQQHEAAMILRGCNLMFLAEQ